MEYNRIINPNQLTGFYMRGTLAFNGLNKIYISESTINMMYIIFSFFNLVQIANILTANIFVKSFRTSLADFGR